MIRVIVRTTDVSEVIHAGGYVHVTNKTFDVDLPELEAFLRRDEGVKSSYATSEVIGIELLEKS